MLMKHLTLFYTHLKWVFDFLLFYPFYKLYDSPLPMIEEDVSVCHYESTPGSNEDVDCAVCLCKIGEGDEIRVLRCDHLFHKECLDKWVVGFKNANCPLCREAVGPRRVITELGAEVLFFHFCSINTSDDDRDTWWLR
ncbi:hypothetical protein RIF29_16230 [Crotalaria pallida]|uniref:RING-type domain-containing protein n=1 Tax=Crotalaria pallida TaxID=3830 RepID=A0AAN9IBU9_CROPI